MKKKVLILSGGISKERLISLDTGLQVAKELKKNSYEVKIFEPDNELGKNIKTFKPDVIFNALQGQFGEDGYIQTILETFKFRTHIQVLLRLQSQWIKKFQKRFLLKIILELQSISLIHTIYRYKI